METIGYFIDETQKTITEIPLRGDALEAGKEILKCNSVQMNVKGKWTYIADQQAEESEDKDPYLISSMPVFGNAIVVSITKKGKITKPRIKLEHLKKEVVFDPTVVTAGIIYSEKTIAIKELKPYYDLFVDFNIKADDFYIDESKYFNHYEKPVITSDNIVLTHWDVILAARKNRRKTIDVIVADNIDSDLIPRYIAFGLFYRKLNYSQRAQLLVRMESYLTTNVKGIEWSKELVGDINHKLAKIIGYKFQYVKLMRSVIADAIAMNKPSTYYFDHDWTFDEIREQIKTDKEAFAEAWGDKSKESHAEPDQHTDDSTEEQEEELQRVNISPTSTLNSHFFEFKDGSLRFTDNGRPLEFEPAEPVIKGNRVTLKLKVKDSKAMFIVTGINLQELNVENKTTPD